MINPNETHNRKGTVTRLSRSRNGSLNLEVTLDNGTKLEELGFVYHKTLKQNDRVSVVIGFRIMSDRYGVESVRRILKGA